MGFIPEEVITKFKFESGFFKTFKPCMDSFLIKRGKGSLRSSKNVSLDKSSLSNKKREE
jgi:hypothetical protein